MHPLVLVSLFPAPRHPSVDSGIGHLERFPGFRLWPAIAPTVIDPARYGRGQDQPRARHRNGLFSLHDPPRNDADLPGAGG